MSDDPKIIKTHYNSINSYIVKLPQCISINSIIIQTPQYISIKPQKLISEITKNINNNNSSKIPLLLINGDSNSNTQSQNDLLQVLLMRGGGPGKKKQEKEEEENDTSNDNEVDENNINNNSDDEIDNENITKFDDIIRSYTDTINQLNHYLKINHNLIYSNEEFQNIILKLNDESILNEKNSAKQKIILTKSE